MLHTRGDFYEMQSSECGVKVSEGRCSIKKAENV